MTNRQLIEKFYTAFQNRDYKTMQSMYADNAHFSDPVFTDLNAQQVRAMWEMLIKRGTDLQLEYKNIEADEFNGTAEWLAVYTFSATGNRVINEIRASFEFENGKIVNHFDNFDFKTWARQALGFKGFLFGGTSFLKEKVRGAAMKSLDDFMKKN